MRGLITRTRARACISKVVQLGLEAFTHVGRSRSSASFRGSTSMRKNRASRREPPLQRQLSGLVGPDAAASSDGGGARARGAGGQRKRKIGASCHLCDRPVEDPLMCIRLEPSPHAAQASQSRTRAPRARVYPRESRTHASSSMYAASFSTWRSSFVYCISRPHQPPP